VLRLRSIAAITSALKPGWLGDDASMQTISMISIASGISDVGERHHRAWENTLSPSSSIENEEKELSQVVFAGSLYRGTQVQVAAARPPRVAMTSATTYNNSNPKRRTITVRNLFSINKAADLLERDRATLVRALRHVKPDGRERGQDRYTMRTITDALMAQEVRNKGSVSDTGVSRELEIKFSALDEQYRNVQNGPTLAERRKLARAFFSFVADVEGAMLADAKRGGEDPTTAQMRAVEHSRLNVLTLREALGWNSDEAWAEFLKADNRVRNYV
jgi:hypothetical protein